MHLPFFLAKCFRESRKFLVSNFDSSVSRIHPDSIDAPDNPEAKFHGKLG